MQITFDLKNDTIVKDEGVQITKENNKLIIEYKKPDNRPMVHKVGKIRLVKKEDSDIVAIFDYEIGGFHFSDICLNDKGEFISSKYSHLECINKDLVMKDYNNIINNQYDLSFLHTLERGRQYFNDIFYSDKANVSRKGLRYVYEQATGALFQEVNPEKDSRISEFARNGDKMMYIFYNNCAVLCANIGGQNEFIGQSSEYQK